MQQQLCVFKKKYIHGTKITQQKINLCNDNIYIYEDKEYVYDDIIMKINS